MSGRPSPPSLEAQEGFSLVELLIVIVVLGILSGVAVFSVQTFKDDATASCTAANAKVMNTAVVAYNAKNGTTGIPSDSDLVPYLEDAGACTP